MVMTRMAMNTVLASQDRAARIGMRQIGDTHRFTVQMLRRGGGERRRKPTPRPAAIPSAAPSRPGSKSAARGVESKRLVHPRAPRHPIPARPKVGGQRRRNQTLRPAARPSAAPAGPGPKSAARGVESKLSIQLRAPPTPPPGQARSRQREA